MLLAEPDCTASYSLILDQSPYPERSPEWASNPDGGGFQKASRNQGPSLCPRPFRTLLEPSMLCDYPAPRHPWAGPSLGKSQAAGLWPSVEAVREGGQGGFWPRARAVGFTIILGPWSSFFILRP